MHAIGQIYDRKEAWGKAEAIYRQTIIRAGVYQDNAWVGIASGSLGNLFLIKGNYDSALFYHRRNYTMNFSDRAPEDAAKSALKIATVFVRTQHLDSALHYIYAGRELARKHIVDSVQQLEYQKNVFIVMIELNKAKQDYKAAFHLSDSLMLTKDILRQKLDIKLLNRAVEKSEVERHQAELNLLESQKSLSRLRYSVLIAVLLSVMIIAALVFNRYRVKKLRQMKLAETEKKETEEKLKQAEELLTAYLNIIREKTSLLENMDIELQRLKEGSNDAPDLNSIAANRERLISSTILTGDDWRQFRTLFEQVHPGFLQRLREKFPDLSPAEMRLLILTRLNLSAREMANMLGISVDAIRKARYRLRKKLNLEEESNLEAIFQQI